MMKKSVDNSVDGENVAQSHFHTYEHKDVLMSEKRGPENDFDWDDSPQPKPAVDGRPEDDYKDGDNPFVRLTLHMDASED